MLSDSLSKLPTTKAKYEALLADLKVAKELGIKRLKVFTNSQLVGGQAREEYEAREPTMVRYLQKLHFLMTYFDYLEICHIPRTENAHADALSRLATKGYEELGRTFTKYLDMPSINQANEVQQVVHKPSWIDAYVNYLINDSLPSDPSETRRIKQTSF